MAYKFQSAYDWLTSYVSNQIEEARQRKVDGDDEALDDVISSLEIIIGELAIKLDSDTIQDLYQSDMDADGYFDEVTE